MKVLSVNIGTPGMIRWGGREIWTAFRKAPVPGPVEFRGVNLLGDDQADRRVHGGDRKAVYVYPFEHYTFWRRELGLNELPFGSFGENLTTVGWLERDARIGDRVRIGSAEFTVVSPRKPCYKLEAAFQRSDMIRRFHHARLSGFYLGAGKPGRVGVGDSIELLSREDGAVSIAEAYPSYSEGAGLPRETET